MKKERIAVMAAYFLIAANLALTAYMSILSWLTASWFIDDSLAFSLAANDWTRIALERAGTGTILGIAAGGVITLLNSIFLRPLAPGFRRTHLVLGILAGTAVIIASVAGSAKFLVTRPYI